MWIAYPQIINIVVEKASPYFLSLMWVIIYSHMMMELITSSIFPSVCRVCGSLGPTLCRRCGGRMRPIGGDWCATCGNIVALGNQCTRCVHRYTGPTVTGLWHLEGTMTKIMWLIKYEGVRELIPELSFHIGLPTLAKAISLCMMVHNPAFIPVPLHPSKERKRSYNQALLFARTLSILTGVPVHDTIVSRVVNTKAQTHITSREARRENIRGAFAVSKTPSRFEHTAIVVDDVITSGSTVREVAATLGRHHIPAPHSLCIARETLS